MPIRLLPDDLVAKIAAGEVIERPVSVAKELLENAIDAGAQDVRLEIVQGGKRLIRVSDDGCGIPADEVELAVQRHATSKLASDEELYRVRTLGFRGEALASVAAVSRLTLSTRAAGDPVGTVLRVEGGRLLAHETVGRAPGTTVSVENLFYNTPARLKFMRADATETMHITRLASAYALAYPDKRIALQSGDRSVLRTQGSGSLRDVVLAIYGLDVVEQMLDLVPAEQDDGTGPRVWGLVGSPSLARGNRQEITLFVNGRWIQDSALAHGITDAYRGLLPAGRYPLAVVHVSLPADAVDVNTHPTKREVRFRDARQVYAAVQRSVRRTLLAGRYVPGPMPLGTSGPAAPGAELGRPLQGRQGDLPLSPDGPGERTIGAVAGPATADSGERLPMLRVLGQLAETYIITEGPGGLYLIDQHAAHERIRYEALKAQAAQRDVAAQDLLEPLPLELPVAQATLLEGHLDELAAFGLVLAPFGGHTFLVRRIPATLMGGDVAAAVTEILEAAQRGGADFSWEEQALITFSCHTAVRAGQALSIDEMRDLVRRLERAALPYACPHGRPTVVQISHAQLERQFGRR